MMDLARRRRLWRRSAGRDRSRALQRHVHELARQHVRQYKRMSGIAELPRVFQTQEIEASWSEVEPDSIKIVLMRAAEASSPDQSVVEAPSISRKRIRRSLHGALASSEHERFELVSSHNVDQSETRPRPLVGEETSRGTTILHGLYLETIGAAIMPTLSDQQIARLQASGAIVLDNSLIAIVEPEAAGPAKPSLPATDKWHLSHINIDAARCKDLSGSGTIIGLLDTGIDPKHPEFKDKTIIFQKFNPNGSKGRLKVPKDYDDHGTHVAALCAGTSIGVAPGAQIAMAAVLTRRERGRMVGFTAQVLAGLNWLARGGDGLPRGVDVLNASMGTSIVPEDFYEAFAINRIGGLLVVASIGNDGHKGGGNHTAPGKFDSVIGVGAVDRHDAIAPFSDWGPTYSEPNLSTALKPDLVAPGVDVNSAIPGGYFGAKSGTSMAAPMVSGTAALLIQRDEQLRHAPEKLANRILGLTRPLPHKSTVQDSQRSGRGCLDLTTI